MAEKRRTAKPLTDAEIEAQAQVKPDDIARAREWWKTHVTGPLKNLLDAEEPPSTDAN